MGYPIREGCLWSLSMIRCDSSVDRYTGKGNYCLIDVEVRL